MASGSVVEAGNEGGEVREKQRYTESKVYTRKAFKGPKRNSLTSTSTNNNTATTTADNNNNNTNLTTTSTAAADNNNVNTTTTTAPSATETATVPTTTSTVATETAAAPATLSTTATKTATAAATTTATANETSDRDNNEELVEVRESEPVVVDNTNTAQQVQQPVSLSIVVSDDSLNLNRLEVQEVVPSVREKVVERGHAVGNGVFLKEGLDNKVKVDLLSRSKQEKRELKKKLESELALVRGLVKRIEAKEMQLGVGRLSNSRVVLVNDRVDNRLTRVNSEVGSVGVPRESTAILTPTPRQSRPLNQLSISVLENSLGVGEFVEKEKRTPKANQFYMNSEFLLAKDKFPPAESNKKSKLIGKKQGAGESGYGFGTSTKIFKNCSTLLDKLMKNKHGWVFNTPVDAKGLGLHDYFTIIRHPMDLGTVKSRLTKNWYKSPEEFAEDVRLTFHNAMKYNPKGQDVHVMAEQLLDIFETKWAVIKSDYDLEMRFAASYEVSIPTPTSRKAPPFVPPPLDMRRILDRSESMTYPIIDTRSRPKPITTTPSSRTPVPKKPKAKDPHKRDMTYDEKQKLSTNLQSLPSEKLDNIVQIIKKRSSALSQHDDEIEVDIDSVDVETLWELDRFVTNYKKSLSKNKRKAELAVQARTDAQQNVQQKIPASVVVEAPKETKSDERNASTLSPVQVEKQGDNGSRSSSSSSSSSDSGSSSSDSDSDNSSASASDVGN
uniref:Bromo domain-containing protein n=1 Tax=Populus davidiana TaxID=266767 RepID=A0A6M2EI98_9ROSI